MNPTELFVRIEGVNLRNFVDDVHNLSVIRGGSFLLLEAVERVRQQFDLYPITTGASSGLFRAKRQDAEKLRLDIRRVIANDEQLRHATIVVDVLETDKGFLHAREALTAMNRWRQLQQPAVAVPSIPEEAAVRECAVDHLRPAVTPVTIGNVKKSVSASVAVRRTFGVKQKHGFYTKEIQQLPNDGGGAALVAQLRQFAFANELETIADDRSRGSLDGKIAVIYFDGNRFGDIQRSCGTEALQKHFDDTLKTYRRMALRRLLEEITAHPSGWVNRQDGADAIRLETLLWGGDELTWVVPAWKGWEVVRGFYDVSRNWVFAAEGKETRSLTHAGGVVFCHRKAPIHRMTKLAKDLAETCKRYIRDGQLPDAHDSRDLFAYQVLESFDHIGTDLDDFRKTRVPKDLSADQLIVSARGMLTLTNEFPALRKAFPRSKLHDIVRLLRDGGNAQELIESTVKGLDAAAQSALLALFAAFTPGGDKPWLHHPTGWFHLLELWDYADPAEPSRSPSAAAKA